MRSLRGQGWDVEDQNGLELQAQVADPGEYAVQVRLVDERTDELGRPVVMEGRQAVEPGGHPVAQPPANRDAKGAGRTHVRDDPPGLRESTSPSTGFTQAVAPAAAPLPHLC